MKLSSITIRGMHNVHHKTYHLCNLNYFTGNNGAGKSTVLQAIQLALLGYIPGTDKTKSGIFSHCNGNMMMVELSIDSDDGDTYTINRTWTKTAKSIVSTVTTIPEEFDVSKLLSGYELPVFHFSEFINLSPNKMKDWFIQFMPKGECEIDFGAELSNAIAHIDPILDPTWIAECIDHASGVKSGIDGVRELHEQFKAELSYKKGEQNRIQHTIQSLVHYDDINTSDDSEKIRCKLADLEKHANSLKEDLYNISKNNELRDDITELEMVHGVTADRAEEDQRFVTLTKKADGITADIDALEDRIQAERVKLAEYMSELGKISPIVEGMGVCPYTDTRCSAVLDRYESACTSKSKLQESIDNTRAKIEDFESKKSEHIDVLAKLDIELADIRFQYSKKQLRLGSLNPNLPCETSEIESELSYTDSQIQEYKDLLIRLEANARYNALIDELTSEKFAIEQCIEVLKIWIKLTDVNGLQATVMNKPFERLFSSMNPDLRSMSGGKFEETTYIMSEKSNDFSFGATKDGTYIEYSLMSSGEKCLYTLSLLLAIVRTSGAELPIILIDDLVDHLDSSRIESYFETLYNTTDVQFVIAGVVEPTHANMDEFVIRL